MKSKWMRSAVMAVIAVGILCGVLWATTWAPSVATCPLCHEKNEFSVVMSYGSYIYGWPSKFQRVFWPSTDSQVLYTCKKCNLTVFMWDFDQIPADKMEMVRKALQGTSIKGDYKHYYEIPMSVRFDIAEKVYSALDKDADFWCHFYRVKGYHLALEKKTAEADAARAKARDLARKMIDDPSNADRRKDLLITSAAMNHFLRDDAAAKTDLEFAEKATYRDKKLNEEENKSANANMNAFITEYLQAIADNKVPKDDGSDK
jgi:hypothetical protein